MSDALPDPPTLDPGSLAGASFSRSRRGFEPTEVRSLLGRVADALRVWASRDEQLCAEVASLRQRVDSAEHLDEARVTELLGAETARIVAAARTAAAEIREHAEADAASLRERTEAELTSRRDQLLSEATADREAAEVALAEARAGAASTIEAATAEAAGLRERSREEADALVAEATRVAEERTVEADASAQQTLQDAQLRHDELLSEATGVLDARTAEAEAAASEIARRAADELETARGEAEQVRREADAAADATREQAREEARGMLEETRGLRHRMLRDLAERRRAARQQIEAARVARQGVVEAIRTAAVRLEDTVDGLDEAEAASQRAADAAAAAVPDDILTVAVELEGRLDAGVGTDAQAGSSAASVPAAGGGVDAVPEPGAPAGEEPGAEHPSEEPAADEPAAGEQPAEGPTADEQSPPAGTGAGASGAHAGAPGEAEDAGAAVPAAEAGPGGEGPTPEGEQLASVHDLFERLRSGTEEPDEDAVDSRDGPLPEPAGDQPTLPDTGAHPSAGPHGRAGGEPALVSVSATAAPDTGEVPATEPDTTLLDRRDEVLAPAERLLARTLKRLVGDEQNEVLDRARRIRKGRVELDDLLGDGAVDRYAEALAEPYRLAAVAGAQMWCELTGDPLPALDDDGVAASLRTRVRELEELRRVHLRAVLEQLDESGEDLSVLVDHLRAAYREMRSTAVPHQAADLSIAGFTVGTAAAAPEGSRWRWVPDNAGQPCADAEDNALAGPLRCGEAFPTGDVLPPAHPGCRCILVPVGPDA